MVYATGQQSMKIAPPTLCTMEVDGLAIANVQRCAIICCTKKPT